MQALPAIDKKAAAVNERIGAGVIPWNTEQKVATLRVSPYRLVEHRVIFRHSAGSVNPLTGIKTASSKGAKGNREMAYGADLADWHRAFKMDESSK